MLTDAQMQELYDKQKLHENLMLYCRGLDRYDVDLIRSTYWPDSYDDHGVYSGPGQGWAEAGALWKERLFNVNHHCSNVLIELDGDRAKRESMFLCVTTYKDPALTAFLGGRYRDLCEKRDGEWRILRRICVWDWIEVNPSRGGWELCGVPKTANWGSHFPHDPIYGDWYDSPRTEFPKPAQTYHTPNG